MNIIFHSKIIKWERKRVVFKLKTENKQNKTKTKKKLVDFSTSFFSRPSSDFLSYVCTHDLVDYLVFFHLFTVIVE